MLIFVYGTLKKGFRNNYLLSTSKYIGKGITKDKFGLYKSICGNYPFAIESIKDTNIEGEIYEIASETEFQLDILEGFPTLYLKKKIKILCENGDESEATTYLKNEENYKDLINFNEKIKNW